MNKLIIGIIKFYQYVVAPWFAPSSCRFEPSCSNYAIQAIDKYGYTKGIVLSLKRLLKCHPFHPGGYDSP